MRKYRSTPQDIEAVQWFGDNFAEIADSGAPVRIVGSERELELLAGKNGAQGWVPVPFGHWVVRNPGDLTDFWPVDPDYFARKYEPVREDR